MTGSQPDPYQAAPPASPSLIRWMARAAIVWGVVYLAYRIVFTLDGVAALAAGVLFAAEALAVAVFALRSSAARSQPVDVVDVPDAPLPSTTAVIDASGASIDELRTTLVSCQRVRGIERIVVADPDGSRWLRTIAERFGATTVEQPALMVVAETSAVWVLSIRAGDLPMPDALEVIATVCSAPDAGIVQLGVEEADPSSFEHDPSGRWSLAPFEHQVVRPSLAAEGSIPWYGDVPTMVRPAAIRSSVGPDVTTVELGLQALRLGFQVTMVPRTLARLRGPQTLGESLRNRFDRTVAARRAAITRLSGVPSPARHAHRVALIEPLAALQRLLLATAAILALGFGQLPLDGPILDLAVMAAPAYLLRWNAQLLLGRGRLGMFSILRSDLRSLGVDATFGFGSSANHQRQRFALLVGLVVALDIAVAVAAFAVWRDWGDRLPAGAAAVALVLTAGFLGVAMEVLLDAMSRRQRRSNHRVRLGLVTCRLGAHEGQLHDLSTGGCGVILAATPDQLPEAGDLATLSFRIPDASGAWRDVNSLVHIAHVVTEGDSETRVGLAFDDPTDAPLDPVVEFLTIDRRLVSLGRRAHETA